MSVEPTPDDPVLVVTVTRTGGITGIVRTWQAQAPPAEYDELHGLVEACPWPPNDDEGGGAPPHADGFTWHIEAAEGCERHECTLDAEPLPAPWDELISAVRTAHD